MKHTSADASIVECLLTNRCFHVIAGAGSGKTASLIRTLEIIRDRNGAALRRDGQKVACLTFTKRAVDVIEKRLRWDDLFVVSTLHSFLWGEISRFSKDIRSTLYDNILPARILRARKDDDGKATIKATKAREKAKKLEFEREEILRIVKFTYTDTAYSNYSEGELGHDDVITVSASLIQANELLRRLIGQRFPYIFVDEAQDTYEEVVSALNSICSNEGLPIIGYFGDPMQQIYDKRAGTFSGPPGSRFIPKDENFRSSKQVIRLLNAFREDLEQFPGGDNANVEGTVKIRCISTEKPELPRNRYSPNQIERATNLLDKTTSEWGWNTISNVKHLYLVHQTIARRVGFESLHDLFDGKYASQKAKEEFETGDYFLLRPFIACLHPLIKAFRAKDARTQVDILRQHTPAFDPGGMNAKRTLADMMQVAVEYTTKLHNIWEDGAVGDVLRYAREVGFIEASERIDKHLARERRTEIYDETLHGADRQDWLVDDLLTFSIPEVERYCEFIAENTVYSTQHGVKGEQYERVLVVFDDVGSAWTQYNFSALLTPKTYNQTAKSDPTDRQLRLSRNLAYVCFSRALVDLRIIYFTSNATSAAEELFERGYFTKDQIEVIT